MAKLRNIAKLLSTELKTRHIPDSSKNGLQVRIKKNIKKIGFAVDSNLTTFKKAKKANCDLLIVHHGLKWKGQKYKKLTKKRENFLKKNNISLYAAHLPLDAHKKYGNNIQLAKILNLKKLKRFGRYKENHSISYIGQLAKRKKIKDIANILNKELKTKCNVYNFGKNKIKNIAICSGGGADLLEEATENKADLFITGEIDHNAYSRAKDYKINLIQAGHYATETVGLKALMPLIKEKFNVKTVFIDNPTGL